MRNISSYIIAATIAIGEIHTFWERSSHKPVSWILKRDVPLTIQWNIKNITDMVNWILIVVAMMLYRPTRENRITAWFYLVFCLLDMVMYFYNYKTYNYHVVYFIMGISWGFFILHNNNRK